MYHGYKIIRAKQYQCDSSTAGPVHKGNATTGSGVYHPVSLANQTSTRNCLMVYYVYLKKEEKHKCRGHKQKRKLDGLRPQTVYMVCLPEE